MSLFLVVLPVLSLLSLGHTGELPQPRIIGGEYVDILEYPFQAMLVRMHKKNDTDVGIGASSCGGVIISERWVLTATHCVKIGSSLLLRMGISDTTDDGHVALVELFHCHEKYNDTSLFNDICLIKTVEPIPFSDRIQPVKLASREEEEQIKSVNVSGWGSTSTDVHPKPNVIGERYSYLRLKAATLSIVDYQNCLQLIYTSSEAHKGSHLCLRQAAYPHSNVGTCLGDSGGPVVGRTKNGTLVLVALVSFGLCGLLGHLVSSPIRVSAYLDWIDSVRSRFQY